MYRLPNSVPLDLDSLAENTPLNRWGGGVAAPIVLLVLGFRILLRHVVAFYIGRESDYLVTLTGIDAVAVALCFLFAAAYVHFHFYWSAHPRLERYAEGGKLVTALLLVLSFAYSAFAMIRFVIVH